jgi:ubiquinone/menaquinone biosynthesis C-methylase UbiE
MQQPATWDAVAAGYAEETAKMALFADEALKLAGLAQGARVLDVAAGSGSLALRAAPHAAGVLAVDFAPAMLEQLRLRAEREHFTNVQTKVMDAQRLELPDGSFDAAFCMFAFMFFPDRGKAFSELLRVLRGGGCAVIATWAPIERRPLMKVGFDALAQAMPGMPAPQKGDLQAPDECVAEMTAAGFRDVTARRVTGSVRFDSPEQYFSLTERANAPLVALKKRLGEQGWTAVRARVLEALAKAIPPTGAELSAEAILTFGRK